MATGSKDDAWSAGTSVVAAADLRGSTRARYSQVFDAFSHYAQARGVHAPKEATPALCWDFVTAAVRGGGPPRTGTSRLRLTVIRTVFEALEVSGIVSADPTTGLRVPHHTVERVPTPLTPPEVSRLVLAGCITPRDTLRPATSALALLGAAHAEIAGAVVSGFSESEATLTLETGRIARVVTVSPYLVEVIRRRVTDQRSSWRRRGLPWNSDEVPLALNRALSSYPVNSVAPTVSDNLGRALRYAGIHRPGVQPKSVREYAANAVYASTQRIEAVAEHLGVSSFDTAARLIDSNWQERWGDVVRARCADDS